jgi:hypothetical protein
VKHTQEKLKESQSQSRRKSTDWDMQIMNRSYILGLLLDIVEFLFSHLKSGEARIEDRSPFYLSHSNLVD